jgi:hypothetical protein
MSAWNWEGLEYVVKFHFMDPAFVREHYRLDQLRPRIQPMFLNGYLAARLLSPLDA